MKFPILLHHLYKLVVNMYSFMYCTCYLFLVQRGHLIAARKPHDMSPQPYQGRDFLLKYILSLYCTFCNIY